MRTIIIVLLMLIYFNVHSQTSFEFGIKPTQFLFKDFEGNAALVKGRNRFGLIFSFRPSTQDSGEVKVGGIGLLDNYKGLNMFNPFYRNYTIGVYRKVYSKKNSNTFFETDLFFRNWNFMQKHIHRDPGVESRYTFNGLRSENVNVYALKLLIGLTKKKNNSVFYTDLYMGLGVRYINATYETFNGTVNEIYYPYNREHDSGFVPTLHMGMRIGINTIDKSSKEAM